MQTLAWTAQMLAAAWTCQGWAELENRNRDAAESYLRAAWKLSQNPIAGYQLGRLLEARGEKAAAAHTWELAYISNPVGIMTNIAPSFDAMDKIAVSYKKVTGGEMTATPLKQGAYNGSLRAELDKDTEIRAFVRETKFNGQGYYAVTYLPDGTVRATLISGDPGMATLAPLLQGHRFPVAMPTGSKARLVREVHLICSPWGGCDAYMLLPTAVTIPIDMKVKVIQVAPPPDAPKGSKVVGIVPEN